MVAVSEIFEEWPAARWATHIVGSVLLALYFLFKTAAELNEMRQKRWSYFKEWWNYLELLVQALILTFFGLTLTVAIEDDV